MTFAFRIALGLHVLCGATALLSLWVPLLAKKGGKVHVRAGWVYVVAAAGIALTAFVNCARMLTDDNPGNDRAGVFLTYVGVLAAASAQIGVRAIRAKRRTTGTRNPIDLAPPLLLIAGGLALAAFGLRTGTPLFVAFAALGTALGGTQLRFWLRAPVTRHDWFLAHMGGMGASCIATVTAFVVVNANLFGLGTYNVFVWMVPAVGGAVGLTVWIKIYERRFAKGARTAPAGKTERARQAA
jgi:uncharacterized membrane protein